jgi:hypothetical protein
MLEGSTCCFEGSHRLHRRLGGAATQTISIAEEGSLPSRPGSKDAEPSDIGYAPLSSGVSKPKANRNQTHLAEANEATSVELPPIERDATQKSNMGHDR